VYSVTSKKHLTV